MTKPTSRRHLIIGAASVAALAGSTALNAGVIVANQCQPSPVTEKINMADPVYAGIAAHRSAWEAHLAMLLKQAHGDETDAVSREIRRTSLLEEECLNALGVCEPTTLQGAAEFLNYTIEILEKEGADYLDTRLRRILTSVMITVATLGGAAVQS